MCTDIIRLSVTRNIASIASARNIIIVVLDAYLNTLFGYSYGVRGLASVRSFVVG